MFKGFRPFYTSGQSPVLKLRAAFGVIQITRPSSVGGGQRSVSLSNVGLGLEDWARVSHVRKR